MPPVFVHGFGVEGKDRLYLLDLLDYWVQLEDALCGAGAWRPCFKVGTGWNSVFGSNGFQAHFDSSRQDYGQPSQRKNWQTKKVARPVSQQFEKHTFVVLFQPFYNVNVSPAEIR